MKQPEIKIYTTDNCHFCLKAKGYFFERNLKYKEIHIGDSQKKREELLKLTGGHLCAPVIIIDKKIFLGFDELNLDVLLDK